jgi:hypothetical protein
VLVSTTCIALAMLPAVARSDPGYGWQSGPLVESQNSNCITGTIEQEAPAHPRA